MLIHHFFFIVFDFENIFSIFTLNKMKQKPY